MELACEVAYPFLVILCCAARLRQIVKEEEPASDAIIQIGGTLIFLALAWGGGLYD